MLLTVYTVPSVHCTVCLVFLPYGLLLVAIIGLSMSVCICLCMSLYVCWYICSDITCYDSPLFPWLSARLYSVSKVSQMTVILSTCLSVSILSVSVYRTLLLADDFHPVYLSTCLSVSTVLHISPFFSQMIVYLSTCLSVSTASAVPSHPSSRR